MERQQNAANGVALINRFSSYFEDAPNILLLAEFPQDAKDRLVADAQAAIGGSDPNAIERLYNWEGVSDSTRKFVVAELEQLRDAKIDSIEVLARNFKGELLHWSAYQQYQPNLPIVGYLDIKYRAVDDESAPQKILSLEMGKSMEPTGVFW